MQFFAFLERVMWTKRQSKALRNREEAEKRKSKEKAEDTGTSEVQSASSEANKLEGIIQDGPGRQGEDTD